jgi:hypothetical protein
MGNDSKYAAPGAVDDSPDASPPSPPQPGDCDDDVKGVKEGDLALVLRSDGKWIHRKLKKRTPTEMATKRFTKEWYCGNMGTAVAAMASLPSLPDTTLDLISIIGKDGGQHLREAYGYLRDMQQAKLEPSIEVCEELQSMCTWNREWLLGRVTSTSEIRGEISGEIDRERATTNLARREFVEILDTISEHLCEYMESKLDAQLSAEVEACGWTTETWTHTLLLDDEDDDEDDDDDRDGDLP